MAFYGPGFALHRPNRNPECCRGRLSGQAQQDTGRMGFRILDRVYLVHRDDGRVYPPQESLTPPAAVSVLTCTATAAGSEIP